MYSVVLGVPVIPAFLLTVALGALIGLGIGLIVVYGRISSLVATLGLNFFILGIVNLLAQGKTITAPHAMDSFGYALFVGKWHLFDTTLRVPNHFIWSLVWVVFCFVLFKYHRFGIRVQLVGDNADSAREMGINIERVRVSVFIVSGGRGGNNRCTSGADGEHGLVPNQRQGLPSDCVGCPLCGRHSHLGWCRNDLRGILRCNDGDAHTFRRGRSGLCGLLDRLPVRPGDHPDHDRPSVLRREGQVKADAEEPGELDEASRDAHPVGRMTEPREAASTVHWIGACNAPFVTGQTFFVDGGPSIEFNRRPETARMAAMIG